MSGARRAKIICTLGPATDTPEALENLIAGGVDAVRLNLSYGTPEEHVARIDKVRELSKKLGRYVAVIFDLPGPKIRVGQLAGGTMTLATDAVVKFSCRGESQPGDIPVDDSFFHDEMMEGDRILLADGVVELTITNTNRRNPTCDNIDAKVVYGGDVVEGTRVHLPALHVREGAMTDADLELLELAARCNADYLALSYVRDGTDVLRAKERLESLGCEIPIIAKIERPEAFSRLDGILSRADAVMIRRGDLGASIELTRVPSVQKDVVRRANRKGVPVIIATQMLGSMIKAVRPTRAEASDVSNAILDGADGVLLSGETAVGDHPLRAVEMMDRIISETERSTHQDDTLIRATSSTFPDTAARIACAAADQAGADLIVCYTASGATARLVASYRPSAPIVACCEDAATRRRLAIHWGVRTVELEAMSSIEKMIQALEAKLLERDLAKPGDRLVIVFGAPVGQRGHTNSLRLHRVRRQT